MGNCENSFDSNIALELQKTAIKEETVEAEAKKAKVTSVKKKAEDLPEIADYDRPDLEKYEKISPTPSTRDKVTMIYFKQKRKKNLRPIPTRDKWAVDNFISLVTMYKYRFFDSDFYFAVQPGPKIPEIKAPEIQTPEDDSGAPKIEVSRERSPKPDTPRKPSLAPVGLQRRGSLIPPPEEMGRRPSLIISDEVCIFLLYPQY